jgi:hypothetical protein
MTTALRTAIILIGLTLATVGVSAQEWTKAYGSARSEFAYHIYTTADGGFISVGTQGLSTGEDHYWIVRFDSAGNKLWERLYGAPYVSYTIFGSSQTRAGGLLFGGFTGAQFSGAEAAVVYAIDSMGGTLWHDSIDYRSSDHFHFMVERREGGYYFGGHTDSKTDASGNMWLLRLDSARNVIWEKEYDNGSSEHAHWGIETRDGGALLLGHADPSGLEKFWLVKVDSNGTKQWDKIFSSSSTNHDSPYHLFETREGNYAMIGGSSNAQVSGHGQVWLLVVDTLGNIVLDKHYGNSQSESFAWSGRQAPDGGFVIAGFTSYATHGGPDVYFVKTKADGSVDFERTIGGSDADYGYDVTVTNGGYVVAGETWSPEIMVGGQGDMLLTRIANTAPVAPSAPMLISPADLSSGLSSHPTLLWHGAMNATRYLVEIATDAAFTSIISQDSSVTDTSMYQGSALASNARYWWRVRAGNSVGWSAYSPTWSFVVGTLNGVDNIDGPSVVLLKAEPNPLSASTTIRFALSRSAHVSLHLYDMLGRTIATLADGDYSAGEFSTPLNASGLAQGEYTCRLVTSSTNGESVTRVLRLAIRR